MSILERIRNKSGLAIVFVGGALALFVISDALQSNSRLFSGDDGTTVGEVGGESIDIKMFEAKVNENEMYYKQQQQKEAIDQGTADMLRDQTWNQMVQEALLTKQYEELGIEVTNDELFDLVQGDNPHDQIKTAPIFQNKETGMFDRALVVRFLKQLQESNDQQAQVQWVQFEDGLHREALVKKFNTLVKKGIYVTGLEAKRKYAERSASIDFDMVAMNFMNVPDTAVNIDDSELKSYFNRNTDKYKEKENGRKMDFVLFEVIPTGDDSAKIEKWVADQVEQFRTATNDTLFVDVNSESKFDTLAHPLSYYPVEVAEQLFNSPQGTVVGPVFKDGKYRIYKVSGVQFDSVFNMRASHILFKTDGTTRQDTLNAKMKAQEVMTQIRNGADFAEMAAQYGTDGTASKGGDLGWFREGSMVPEFNDFVKSHSKGEMGIVQTQFGMHLVKVTGDKSKKAVCAGVIERTVEPSEETIKTVYNQASQFAAAISDNGDFDAIVADQGLTKRLADNVREGDKQMAGHAEAREVVRWAYNAKVDDVSDVITVGDKFIVAKLTGIKEKGKADFETAKDLVLSDYRKDKKAEQLIEQAKKAVEGAKDMQEIAQKLQLAVTPVTAQIFENGSVAYVGPDNSFVGHLFGNQALNKISGPFKGDNAVYIYSVKKVNDAPSVTDFSSLKMELLSGLSQRFEYGSFEALKELDQVKDNRHRFY